VALWRRIVRATQPFQEAIQRVIAFMGRLADQGVAAVKRFVGGVRSMIDGVIAFLGTMGPRFVKFGNEVVDAILRGITENADKIVDWFKGLSEKARNFTFFPQGKEVNTQLAAGITAGRGKSTQAVAGVARDLADHFPQSPVKRGPLRNLHRLKWGETMAMGVRSGPLVAAMSRAMAATLASVTVAAAQAPTIPLPRVAPGVRVDATGRAARSERSIELAVHVHLPPGTGKDTAEQARRGALAASPELVKLIERTIDERDHRRARTTFQQAR
jgi:hypothetical protein